jgi:hypothetical protein
MLRVLRIVVCCHLLGVSLTVSVSAGLNEYGTRMTRSSDEQFILVRIHPDRTTAEELSNPGLNELEKTRIRSIRSAYAESGLYRNDGSTTPIWIYDGEWCSGDGPIIAPDGMHVIFPGRWLHDEYASTAVAFRRNGILLRSYNDTDLIKPYYMKAVLNGLRAPTCKDAYFDAQNMTYTIRTNQNEELVFDVTTGAIVSKRSPFYALYVVAAVTTLMFIVAAAIWLRRRWRTHTPFTVV